MNERGFALIQTAVASVVIALVLAGAIQYQGSVTKTLVAKRYMATADKVETNLRTQIARYSSLYASAVSESTSALGRCIVRNASGLKQCSLTQLGAETFTDAQWPDLKPANPNGSTDPIDDIDTVSPIKSKKYWRFGLNGFSKTASLGYFDVDGKACAAPSETCQFEVKTYFRPICEPYGADCERAKQIKVRYDLRFANETVLSARAGLKTLVRQGSFIVDATGVDDSIQVRFRQDPNTQTQQCIALYLNRKTLLFGSCGAIYPNTPLGNAFGQAAPTPHFTAFATTPSNAALGEATYYNGSEQVLSGPSLASTPFTAVPVPKGCTFSVLGLTWVPKRTPAGTTRCDKPGDDYNPGGGTAKRKCGLYVSYYSSVNNQTKTGNPAQLLHNSNKVWSDFSFDWPSYDPLTFLQEIRRDASTPSNIGGTTTYPSQLRPPASATSVLTDSTGYKGNGFWPSFSASNALSPQDYYFKLEDGGDWESGQDLAKVDFGLEVRAEPHVCKHVGWEEATSL